MQDRYAGDVGDFGKIGILRILAGSNLRIGVNWYLVSDEVHNDDGKHIGYLSDSKFIGCDDELLGKLGYMVYGNQRSISMLENMNLISNAVYYNDQLLSPQESNKKFRNEWHSNALQKLTDTDIVFLDPDNGLLPKSVYPGSKLSIKYIFENEIVDYYSSGHSVIFYNHRSRLEEDTYLNRFRTFFQIDSLCSAFSFDMKFVRGTIRDYFFLIHNRHIEQVKESVLIMMNSNWNQHCKYLRLD
ncbi:MAG: hypothetical protein VB118_00760 [Oscillospiraceae bacterium]|nr:hypothetical protein [Oscillospiraceae bacterium]